MRIISKVPNSHGEIKVTFAVTIEGREYEYIGFILKNGKFEFAKNEPYYLEKEIGLMVYTQYHADLQREQAEAKAKSERLARIRSLELERSKIDRELNELKGVASANTKPATA